MLCTDDVIAAPPTIDTATGRAWELDLLAIGARRGIDRADDSTVATWLIEAPWAHPVWHSYALVLVHLRPMPDNRPTKIYLDGATHELRLYTLDPLRPRQPMLDLAEMSWLRPLNFAAQFTSPDDEHAADRIRGAVVMICDGRLSPDTDFMIKWIEIFGSATLRAM